MTPENATFGGQATLTLRGVTLGTSLEGLRVDMVLDRTPSEPIRVPCVTMRDAFLPSRQVRCRLETVPGGDRLTTPKLATVEMTLTDTKEVRGDSQVFVPGVRHQS